MKNIALPVCVIAVCILTACNKTNAPAPSANAMATASRGADPVQMKLQDYAGSGATNCGRLEVRSAADQLKTASDCAMQANQNKRPFYVSYEMPGMAVGVAGDNSGKLFTVQSQGSDPSAPLTAGNCPSQLRVASSGRVTCFAPGDMNSMSGSHGAGSMPPGMPNPHNSGAANPHSSTPKTQ